MNEEKKEELNDNSDSGISIRDIFRIIGKKIWFALAGAVAVTIAAVLVFMFAVNPAKQYESMSFRIDYPMSSNGKYPDGSTFNYRDIASRGVIEAAKNNADFKEEFASVDVDKILKIGAIQVSASQNSSESNAAYTYTVTLKSSAFSGISSEHFIAALVDAFTSFVEDKAGSLDYKLDGDIFNSSSFEDQLLLLTEQKSVIMQRYDELIREYSAGHVVGSKSLGSYRMEVETMLADTVKIPIENDLSTRGYEYFNKSVTADEVKVRVQQLQEELQLDRAILEELKSYYTDVSMQAEIARGATTYAADEGSNETTDNNNGNIIIMPGDSNLSQRMAYYSERYAIVKQQLAYLTKDNTIDETTNLDSKNYDFTDRADEIARFGDKLLAQYNILNERADTLTRTISSIYNRDTLVTFNSQRASEEGGTSLMIVAVGAFVVAFVVFLVVAFLVGKKNSKPKKSAGASEEVNGKNE